MKIKTIIIMAALTALLCCKNETNVKENARLRAAKVYENNDSSKQEKITVIKNNEYFLLNDRKQDQ